MSEIESVRDPLEVAAGEAAQLMADWKTSAKPWLDFMADLHSVAEEAGRRELLAMRIHAQFLSRDGQLPLIPGVVSSATEPKKPRAKRRVLMHECGGEFACPKCGSASPYPAGTTESGIKRGVPCPKCNGPAAEQVTT